MAHFCLFVFTRPFYSLSNNANTTRLANKSFDFCNNMRRKRPLYRVRTNESSSSVSGLCTVSSSEAQQHILFLLLFQLADAGRTLRFVSCSSSHQLLKEVSNTYVLYRLSLNASSLWLLEPTLFGIVRRRKGTKCSRTAADEYSNEVIRTDLENSSNALKELACLAWRSSKKYLLGRDEFNG